MKVENIKTIQNIIYTYIAGHFIFVKDWLTSIDVRLAKLKPEKQL